MNASEANKENEEAEEVEEIVIPNPEPKQKSEESESIKKEPVEPPSKIDTACPQKLVFIQLE